MRRTGDTRCVRNQTHGLIARLVAAVLLLGAFVHSAEAHVHGCHTRKCDRRVHEHRVQKWCLRHARCVWKHRFAALPPAGKYWARCVTGKESNWNRYARNGQYVSYFQWSPTTARSAGLRRYPTEVTWYEQAVRAWFWHLSHPHGQWPNTGENGVCGS